MLGGLWLVAVGGGVVLFALVRRLVPWRLAVRLVGATLVALSLMSGGAVAAVVTATIAGGDPYCAAMCLLVDIGLMSWWQAFAVGCWC